MGKKNEEVGIGSYNSKTGIGIVVCIDDRTMCMGTYTIKFANGQAAQLAQSEERSAFNRVVVGSIPTLGAAFLLLRVFFPHILNRSSCYCSSLVGCLHPCE